MESFTIAPFTFRRIYLSDITDADKSKLLDLLGDYQAISQMFDKTIATIFKMIHIVSPNKIFEIYKEAFNGKMCYHYLVENGTSLVANFTIADNELGLLVHHNWRGLYITKLIAPKVLEYLHKHYNGDFYFTTRPYNKPMNKLVVSLGAKLESSYVEPIDFVLFSRKMPTNKYVF